jgi:hypothetical protein
MNLVRPSAGSVEEMGCGILSFELRDFRLDDYLVRTADRVELR